VSRAMIEGIYENDLRRMYVEEMMTHIDNLVCLCATCHKYVHQDNLEKMIERAIQNEDYC